MDRVADLALFLRVLDLGSISAAARSLDLSAAVASQRLKRLERDLGVRLLHRTTRRLHATAEGLELAERGRAPIEELDALTAGLRRAGSEPAGLLRVTTSASFGRMYISPLLPAFQERCPAVRLSVNLSDERVDLVAAGMDLAIRIGALDDSSLVARKLADNRRVLAASPAYLRRHRAPAQPQDLADHECLLLVGAQGRSDYWRLVDAAGGATAVRVNGRLESNFGEVLRDAALAGLGIAHFSAWHVHEDLRAGRLLEVLPGYRLPDTGIHAVMPQRRFVPLRVRAFVDFVAESFGPVPPWERGAGGQGGAAGQRTRA